MRTFYRRQYEEDILFGAYNAVTVDDWMPHDPGREGETPRPSNHDIQHSKWASEGRGELRQQFVCDVIRDYAPDVLGVQEAYRFQLDEFNKRLPEYGEVGIGRDGEAKGEHSSILYLQKRFDVDESGTFWLSDTPTKPSAHWGNRYQHCA